MERQDLKQYLSEAHILLSNFSAIQEKIDNEKYRIMFYSRKRLFFFFGVLAGIILYNLNRLLLTAEGQKPMNILFFLIFGVIVVRFILCPILDDLKRKKMKKEASIRFAPLVEEMSRIAYRLAEDDILPEKYRTFHAVSHLLSYMNNKRTDSLKEGLNLYETELSTNVNQAQMKEIIGQNNTMIKQNFKRIRQQAQMIRAINVTNVLIWFK